MSTRPDGPHRDNRRNVEINLGKVCNSRCVFCLDGQASDSQKKQPTFEELTGEIRRWGAQGHRSLGLLGGEPTVYPKLVEAIDYARDQGFTRITLATNGMRLGETELVDRLLGAGLTRVTISMHSHTAELEDRLTRVPGAFEKKTRAIRHLLRRQAEGLLTDGVSINLVLNGWNQARLLRIQRFFFVDLGVQDLRINFIRAEGHARGSRDLAPRFPRVVPLLMKAIALNELHYQRTLTVGGFPLCVFPRSFLDDPGLVRRVVGEFRDMVTDCSIRSEGDHGHVQVEGDRARFNWQERKRLDLKSRPEACGTCAVAHLCEGVWKAYLEIHGDEDFRPVDPAPVWA